MLASQQTYFKNFALDSGRNVSQKLKKNKGRLKHEKANKIV